MPGLVDTHAEDALLAEWQVMSPEERREDPTWLCVRCGWPPVAVVPVNGSGVVLDGLDPAIVRRRVRLWRISVRGALVAALRVC